MKTKGWRMESTCADGEIFNLEMMGNGRETTEDGEIKTDEEKMGRRNSRRLIEQDENRIV